MRFANAVYMLLVCSALALAQNKTTVTASFIGDASGTVYQSARLCFIPVDANQSPLGFRSGAAQVIAKPVCPLVSNGVLQSGFQVYDSAHTVPLNVRYHIYATPSGNTATVLRDFGSTAITGSSWSMDSYDAQASVLPMPTYSGTVTWLAPTASPTVTLRQFASNYFLDVGVPQGAKGDKGDAGTVSTGGTNGDFAVSGQLTANSVAAGAASLTAADSGTTANASLMAHSLKLYALGVPYSMTAARTWAQGNVSPDASVWDIFPIGYNPWPHGIVFEDAATSSIGCALCLGVAHGTDGESQHLRLYSHRGMRTAAQSGDLYATGLGGAYLSNATLNWTGGVAFTNYSAPNVITRTYANSGYDDVWDWFAPNDTPGAIIESWLGVDKTNDYNALRTQFHYAGSANALNYGAFGFHGRNNVLMIYADGHMVLTDDHAPVAYYNVFNTVNPSLSAGSAMAFNVGLDNVSNYGSMNWTYSMLTSPPDATVRQSLGFRGNNSILQIFGNGHVSIQPSSASYVDPGVSFAVNGSAVLGSLSVSGPTTLGAVTTATATLGAGSTTVTQAASDSSALIATTAQVHAALNAGGGTLALANTVTGKPSGCVQSPCVIIGPVETTGLTANVTATPVYTPPASGWYRLNCTVIETTTAGTSATLPACQASYNNATDNVAKLWSIVSSVAGVNTLLISAGGSMQIHAKAGVPIQILTASYASSPAAVMTYSLTYSLEWIQ